MVRCLGVQTLRVNTVYTVMCCERNKNSIYLATPLIYNYVEVLNFEFHKLKI